MIDKARALGLPASLGVGAMIVLIAMSFVARAGVDILLLLAAGGAGWFSRGSYDKKKEKG